MARKVLIEVRRDTAANWTSANPTLAAGEFGYETDTGKVKIGDGSSIWVTLPYLAPAAAGGTPLTTKGDLFGYSTVNARVPVGTNGQVLTADSAQALGLKWATPAGGSIWTVLTKPSDTSRASTTALSADPDLQFAGTSGGIYIFYFFPVYGSPAGGGTPNFKFSVGEDASARGGYQGMGVSTASAIVAIALTATNNTTTTVLGTATTDRGAFVQAFHISAGGTVAIQWAQNTSSANATILRAGSMLMYTLIGT